MEPRIPSRQLPTRADDYRVRPHAEAKSWAPVEAEAARIGPSEGARIYTHNAERFASRQPMVTETVEDIEPTVPQPPQWMLVIAGAAVAALMGALLGGFMHI